MKPTGVLFFPAFDWAISPTHPEREERLLYTRDQLFEEGIMDMPEIREYHPRLVTAKEISRIHFCVPDVASRVTQAHLVSAGSALVMADAFMKGEVKNAFAIIRPPGHHAMTVSHGNRGFCDINNEAIMVEYLRQTYGVKRLAIVDTDVHHGDGTQEIFWHDPDTLFISFHQDGRTLYPGSGFVDELGGPLAYGATINIPMAPRTTDAGIHYIMDNLVLPILDEFKPELIINSAGQDNHYSDPLANMSFTAQGYAILNQKLRPHIAVLEGGYSVETALPYINMGIIMAMAGIDFSNLREPDYEPDKFTESSKNMGYIKSLVKTQLANFRNREEVIARNRRSGKEFESVTKSIFYDTDYLQEGQRIDLRLCPACCGFRRMESSAVQADSRRYTALCVSLPRACCSACATQALSIYEDMKSHSKYDYLYLQDRIGDKFRTFDCSTGQETVI
ncbi:MAG: histone deacetylase [Syntrophobacterales bacterium]|jgi:acetoin utilization deacetylase AcuC-like enzyme|nr:histone deacetylase [Syntrophobacterales bacterium]